MTMTREQFQRAAEVVGRKTGMDVLNELSRTGRGTASSIAEATGLHTATVMKHLGALAHAGLLETRVVQGKTREMVEYILPSSNIVLSLDLSKTEDTSEKDSGWAITNRVLEKVERVYGESLDPPPSGLPYDLFLLMENQYGRERSADLFASVKSRMEKDEVDTGSLLLFLDNIQEEEK